jgi:hypothetical protein
MEIINKRHEDLELSRRTESTPYINFNTSKQILFSVHAVRKFGLCAGLYVHFVNDDDLWFFYVNDDKDGFEIFSREGKTNTFLYNAHLVSVFLKRTGKQLNTKFILEETKAMKNGCKLIKIIIK